MQFDRGVFVLVCFYVCVFDGQDCVQRAQDVCSLIGVCLCLCVCMFVCLTGKIVYRGRKMSAVRSVCVCACVFVCMCV